jgi:argininosuccinate lyase
MVRGSLDLSPKPMVRVSSSGFPHPSYLQTVLKPNFDHSVGHFFRPLIEINRAHAIMLARCGIIQRSDGARILGALKQIANHEKQMLSYRYRGAEEDLFFHVERRLEGLCGREVAGHLSVARSRNDIDIALYRMVLRKEILQVSHLVSSLQGLLLKLSGRYIDTLFPVITHTQLAQPTTLAHYLMAAVEFLQRDLGRLCNAYQTVNQSPLGACVATTTGFPIDRKLLSELLGFSSVLENAYGCTASVDYLIESVSAVSTLMINLGRLIQDLLDWSSQDSQLIRLADGFVQCSSIMPQKRNPVALEHLRVLASCALGQCQAVALGLHNTPFGDIVDAEDDIQPVVRNAFDYASRVLELLTQVLASLTIDRERARIRCQSSGITLTELADFLVRDNQLPFRTAHSIVSRVANDLEQRPSRRRGEPWAEGVSDLTARFSREITGKEIRILPRQMSRILDPARFVAKRKVLGGPAPETVRRSIRRYLEWNAKRRRWLDIQERSLRSYSERLAKLER